ncbi:MAG: sugar phosphate nucleotidyltransferase [Alphaproteobacteria bacterium]
MYDNIEFIIACGGRGTRNYPHSKGIPHKALLPFGDVRLIDVVLKDIVDMGARHVTLVCSNQTVIEAFQEALGTDTKTEEKMRQSGRTSIADALHSTFLPDDMDVKYVIQDKPLGTSHVLGLAHRVSPHRHGVLIFPDDLIINTRTGPSHIKKLVDDFLLNEKQVSITGVEKEDVSNNSIIQNGRLIEKPKHPTSFIGGYSPMVFPKEVLDLATQKTNAFEQTGHLEASTAIPGEWIYTDLVNEFLDKMEAAGTPYGLKMFLKTPEYLLMDTGTLPLFEQCQLYALLKLSRFKQDNIRRVRELLAEMLME